MPIEQIVTELSMKLVRVAGSPSQVVFAITMQDVIAEVAKQIGDKAMNISAAELLKIRDEVRSIIQYELDARDYIQPGIETWRACNPL